MKITALQLGEKALLGPATCRQRFGVVWVRRMGRWDPNPYPTKQRSQSGHVEGPISSSADKYILRDGTRHFRQMFTSGRIIRLRRRHQVSKLALLAFVGLVAVSLACNDWAFTPTTLRVALGPNGIITIMGSWPLDLPIPVQIFTPLFFH